MTPERWQRVDEIFQAAIELDPGKRAVFLDTSCAGDEELRSEVESLISCDEQGLSFVDEPAFQVAAGLLMSDEPELAEGQHIGHYEIDGLIGKGGMGEVYLAKDNLLNRRVALKLLPADYTRHKDRLRRFQQEAQAASALNHPNILTIYELGQVNGQQFIATEFVEGETLRQRLKRAALNLRETLDIAIQIGSALSTAHNAGIVHRDIKPENIMLRPDGYAKVLDFGLAKLAGPYEATAEAEAADRPDISSGLLMGTVKYMSPEQARGRKVDARSDIFSFGVVLYEMLAGHTPFDGETSSELVASILQREPPRLTGVANGLRRIVDKALSKKREDRYQKIEELLIDLKTLNTSILVSRSGIQISSATTDGAAFSTSGATAVSTTSTIEYLISGITRHKIIAALTFAGVALIGVSLTFSLNRLRSEVSAGQGEMATTVTIPGNAGPWLVSLNPAYPYTANNDYSAPTVVSSASGIPFAAGSTITITYVSGAFTGDAGASYLDANGSTVPTNTYDSFNGRCPGFYMNPGPIVYTGELVGAFAKDGIIVRTPFLIGNGPTILTIPAGATQLLMGINDNYYSDNGGALIVRVAVASKDLMTSMLTMTGHVDGGAPKRIVNNMSTGANTGAT